MTSLPFFPGGKGIKKKKKGERERKAWVTWNAGGAALERSRVAQGTPSEVGVGYSVIQRWLFPLSFG